jgi:hypothetical protein
VTDFDDDEPMTLDEVERLANSAPPVCLPSDVSIQVTYDDWEIDSGPDGDELELENDPKPSRTAKAGSERPFYTKPDGVFIWHYSEKIASPAWSVLPLMARRILEGLELEFSKNWKNNGRLAVPFDTLQRYAKGDSNAAWRSIQLLQRLGFVGIDHGRFVPRDKAKGENKGKTNQYRLTWLDVFDAQGRRLKVATNDWRRIKTEDEAKAIYREVYSLTTKRKNAQAGCKAKVALIKAKAL